MLSKIFNLLLQHYRKNRLARFTAWVLAGGAVLWLLDHLTHSNSSILGLFWFVFWIFAIVSCVYYLVLLLRVVRRRLLWRLQRRLVVAYILIGVVPISLIVLLVFLGTFIINGQFAAFLVVHRLRDHFDEIEQVNRVVLHEARYRGSNSPQELLAGIEKFYLTEMAGYTQSYPGLAITLHLGEETRSFLLNGQTAPNPGPVPNWIQGGEFANIVTDGGQLALRSVERAKTPAGELTLVLSQPITPALLDLVGEGIGPVIVFVTREVERNTSLSPGLRVESPRGTYVQSERIHSSTLKLPEPSNLLDFYVGGASSLDPINWGADRPTKAGAPSFVYVSSRIYALNSRLLATLGEYSEVYVFAFKAVAVFFLLLEVVALVIGIRMTRSMTRTVDTLYHATEHVKAGDFSYRTNFPPRDQLTALGEAFDNMTASVARLMRESQERLRLQSELDIAREVQRRLFPEAPPKIAGLDIYGVCKAARSVSGDYYDFLKLDDHRVALVLGDVSGKGISAALLMAGIQSALRAQLYDGAAEAYRSGLLSPSQIVDRLNRLLYANTPVEKYVTFFFSIYDAATRRLAYTNAGHLPPALFRNGGVERLDTGGTVVGLFPSVNYEVGEVQLQPSDLLLAYTDGITEPENTYGEEFGETRLLQVAQAMRTAPPETLVAEVYRCVEEWTGSPELQDDMTMLLARAW